MAKKSRLVNQNWWITTLLVNEHRHCPPLTKDIKCDVAIVGGGFAGVAAAIEFLKSGHKVVLLDKNIIGGSSSGRSAGFLTPDSELELHQLVRRYGVKAAGEIWQAPLRGIERLVAAIQKHDIQCGLLKQDSLFLGLGKGGKEAVDSELHCRQEVGFTDQKTYDEQQLKGILGAEGFSAGIRYGGTYGINPLACLQGFKNLLVDHGMQIYESTEMERLEDHTVYTHAGSVTADKIIIAVDKLEESISPLLERSVSRADIPEHFRTADRPGAADPVPVGRADAVLGFEAGLHLLPADRRQPPAARRRHADHHLPEGRVQQSAHHPQDHQRVPRALPGTEEPVVHAVLAGADRRDPRPAADHRQAAGPAAHPLHLRLGRHSVGDVHRQLHRAQHPRRRRRGLPEVLQLLLQRTQVLPAERPRQGHRQAAAVLADQQLGEVLPGRQAARSRPDWRKNSEVVEHSTCGGRGGSAPRLLPRIRLHRRARLRAAGDRSAGEISLRRRGSQRPRQHGMVEAVSRHDAR